MAGDCRHRVGTTLGRPGRLGASRCRGKRACPHAGQIAKSRNSQLGCSKCETKVGKESSGPSGGNSPRSATDVTSRTHCVTFLPTKARAHGFGRGKGCRRIYCSAFAANNRAAQSHAVRAPWLCAVIPISLRDQ